MSYIVPREKPKCYNCPFRTLDYCGLLIEHDCVTVNVNEMTVSEYCPLVDIPTPHGRLIDADKLKSRLVLDNDSNELQRISADILKWIDIQETVIEGSET